MRSFCILFGVFLLIYCNECTNKYFPLFIYDNRPQTTENETEEMYDFMFNFCSSSRTGAHMTRLYDSRNTRFRGVIWPPKMFRESSFLLNYLRMTTLNKQGGFLSDMSVFERFDFNFHHIINIEQARRLFSERFLKLDKTSNSSTIPTTTTTPINGQNVLHALLGNLEDYPPYTQIYVITFAPTTFSDEDLIGKILEQIQIKRSQVNFFIRGEYPSGIDYLKEYSLITSVGNGVTWRSFEFNQFTDWKSQELNAMLPKANLLTIYDTDNGTYCMTIDSLLETDIKDMIFSSFDSNEYEVTVTLSREPNRTTLVNEKEKDAENTIQTITTKEMCVEVRRKFQSSDLASFYTLRGFSKSEFDFYYGFSTDNVTSLNETYRRPIKGKSNKIYVSSYSENTRYGFDHFKILFLNGTSSGETISFEPIPDTDLFVGSFEPPNKEYFYIQVTTYANGETISRMSHTAMNTADEFGEEKQNPTFERKPIVYRGYSRSKIFVEIQKETQKEIQKEYNSIGLYNTIGIIIIAIMLLIVLPFIWATIFRLYYQPPERSERGRGVSEPLGIEKARRRAMPNDYHIMHVSQV